MKALALLIVAAAAACFAPHASAQLPPELLGGGSGVTDKFHSEPFFKSAKEGMWVLMREHSNNGFKCSVNFINADGTLAIHGPWDAEMQKKQAGMVWFQGNLIPKAGGRAEKVRLDLGSLDGPQKGVPAMHLNLGESGMVVLFIDIRKMLKEKRDTDRITLTMDGTQVFDMEVVQMQKAYARLGACMDAAKR